MANCITFSRILFSVLLLYFPAFSSPFIGLYIFCGVSDMLDGFIARKTGTVTELGARLDSVADLLFLIVAAVKLLPFLHLPSWLWVWAGGIALIKVINILSSLLVQGKIVFPHTVLNKLAGFLLFVFPLTMSFIDVTLSAVLLCIAATAAAVQEGHLIRTGRTQA